MRGTLISESSELSAEEKHAELQRVIHSNAIENAHQLQRVLEFVATRAIDGCSAEVTESILAEKVFGRSAKFDPATDTSVRTSVYRLRSKLREYYATQGKDDPIVIEIPKGHYLPVFKRREPQEDMPLLEAAPPTKIGTEPTIEVISPPTPLPKRSTSHIYWALAGLLAVLCCAVFVEKHQRNLRPGAFDAFWSPFVSSTKPVLIYTGTNVTYRFSRDYINQYSDEHHLDTHGLEFPIALNNERVQHLEADTQTFITKEDSYAGALLGALLSRSAAPRVFRYGPDVSYWDLRSEPTILIGAFNNSWTLKMTNELRFVFERGNRIAEQSPGHRSWTAKPDEDWALVSRLLSSKTGATLMTIAGIGAIGTQAAAEFVTDPQRLDEWASSAPNGWNKKNIQIVLHTRVIADTPSRTEVAATCVW